MMIRPGRRMWDWRQKPSEPIYYCTGEKSRSRVKRLGNNNKLFSKLYTLLVSVNPMSSGYSAHLQLAPPASEDRRGGCGYV
ncbi:unnamed protein product [Allacma fusca]|uniref:Uncharacterized protein n=1 Tax=Allacma fusca TaxID=39272 RepID=A0A8J2KPH3_9HEXA|nr:unnamed protein product [Allacma fusca]